MNDSSVLSPITKKSEAKTKITGNYQLGMVYTTDSMHTQQKVVEGVQDGFQKARDYLVQI